jgi:hypothetical protein
MPNKSRVNFVNSWLTESPSGTGESSHDMFRVVAHAIRDRMNYGSKAVELHDGYKKLVGEETAFYWHEIDNEIDIAVELVIKPQTLVVTGLGKRIDSPTHATNLYTVIVRDTKCALRLMSEDLLSNQGLEVWKRLLNAGHTISVYDIDSPNNGLISPSSEQEILQYLRLHNNAYKRYRYVLTESGEQTGGVRSYFNTRRMRYIAGIL